jgi:hypothetical protein
MSSNTNTDIKSLSLPYFQLIIALLFDFMDLTGVLGYFISIPFDFYLYYWSKKYLGLNSMKEYKDRKNRLLGSMHIRLLFEYIPFLNFLPVSTFYVLSIWWEKRKESHLNSNIN